MNRDQLKKAIGTAKVLTMVKVGLRGNPVLDTLCDFEQKGFTFEEVKSFLFCMKNHFTDITSFEVQSEFLYNYRSYCELALSLSGVEEVRVDEVVERLVFVGYDKMVEELCKLLKINLEKSK